MNIANSVHLVGHLTHDLEQKQHNGRSFVSFQLAVNNTWKDKTTGELKSHSTFVSATAWGLTADTICNLFKKGSSMVIAGELRTSSWEKDGEKRYRTFVQIDAARSISQKEIVKEGAAQVETPIDPDIFDPEDLPF